VTDNADFYRARVILDIISIRHTMWHAGTGATHLQSW